jgi:superfamily II DNA/RNA helicase
VHRAGRTARAGRPGKVVSLMSEFDVPRVEEIEKRIGKQLQLLETKDLCNACF